MTRFSADDILNVFTLQAEYCTGLGSPFMGKALILVRDLIATGDTKLARAVLNWPGDPRTSADSVPLRVMGGLHALVLTKRDGNLSLAYPPHGTSDLKSALKQAITTHADFLIDWIRNAPQTNETARQGPLVAVAGLLSSHFDQPLHLRELGASAGLNLRWDHIAVDTGRGIFGNPDPALMLAPDWKGAVPESTPFAIASSKGVDLNPLDPTDPSQALRLLAYIWPDQPDRLARARAAINLATELPIQVAKSDAIEWLSHELPNRPKTGVTIIYHTVAWQYFPTEQQARGTELIKAAGDKASLQAPLAWVSMEADDTTPGAALTLRLWPGDHHIHLGRSDFHGRWVQWDAPSSLPSA